MYFPGNVLEGSFFIFVTFMTHEAEIVAPCVHSPCLRALQKLLDAFEPSKNELLYSNSTVSKTSECDSFERLHIIKEYQRNAYNII